MSNFERPERDGACSSACPRERERVPRARDTLGKRDYKALFAVGPTGAGVVLPDCRQC
jgi:hypothetical protein